VEVVFNQASVSPDAIRIKDISSAPVVGGGRIAFCVSGLEARGGDYRGIFLLQGGTVTRVVDNHTKTPEKVLRYFQWADGVVTPLEIAKNQNGSSLFSVGEHVQLRPGGSVRKLAGGANPELSTQLL